MKVRDIIDEAPLPDDWDKTMLTPQQSYKKRIEYVVQRAQKVGRGSSRTAFTIQYDNRPTVLKVAHNDKGMAQNKVEVDVLEDGYASQLGIIIPIIDYDTDHPQPAWIHTEHATKTNARQLCKLMQCDKLDYLVDAAKNMLGKRTRYHNVDDHILKLYGEDGLEIFHDYAQRLADLSGSNKLELDDFSTAENWGLYNGQPVVIDVGLTPEVFSNYYKK
jgi:hypothetical protein